MMGASARSNVAVAIKHRFMRYPSVVVRSAGVCKAHQSQYNRFEDLRQPPKRPLSAQIGYLEPPRGDGVCTYEAAQSLTKDYSPGEGLW